MATLIYSRAGLFRSSVKQRRFYGMCFSGKVSVNGVNVHYQRTGDGKHTVLLLPGALGSAQTDFAPQLEKLDKQCFTLVAFDPRGYGRSRPPDRDFPHDFFHRDAKDAVDLMQALGFGRFSVVGCSDGGITALITAALNPALVQKMVVWGSNTYVSEEDVQIYQCETRRQKIRAKDQTIRDVSLWSERMRLPMEEMYGAQYFRQTWERWVDGISRFSQNPQGNICREVLPLISCPTLIVHGAKDPMVPSFHAEYLQQNIRGSRLHVMLDAKHNLHLRFSTEFNTLLQDFLTQSSAPAPL